MNLNQKIVDWASAQRFFMRAKALYEKRKPNEVFINPNTKHRVVFVKVVSPRDIQFLTHEDVRKAMS